jgi:hypothetical protein
MYSFDAVVYEYITYVDSGLSVAREHMFINGNASGNTELLAGWCQNGNGYRETVTPTDIMLPVMCYTFCSACSTVTVNESARIDFSFYPNPASEVLNVSLVNTSDYAVSIADVTGREVYSNAVSGRGVLNIDVSSFARGAYFIKVVDQQGKTGAEQFIIQ